MDSAGRLKYRYDDVDMGNGLRRARDKAGMSQNDVAVALGMSEGGYAKIERGERKMSAEFIRRACELFGLSADEIMGDIAAQELDLIKLEDLVSLARERLGSLPADEAKVLIRSLISAARKPSNPGPSSAN